MTLIAGLNETTKLIQDVLVTDAGEMKVMPVGERIDVQTPVETSVAWAASAVVNSVKTVTLTAPVNPSKINSISVRNPSIITDLEVDVFNLKTIGGVVSPSFLGGFTVPKATNAVVEDCEDAWAEVTVTNVTSEADATDKKVGSNSQKFTIGADFTTGIVGTEALGSATNLSIYNSVWFWIKSSVATQAGDLQLLLDNTAECASPVETLDIPALAADTWTLVILSLANRPNDTAIISVGLKLIRDLGAQVINIDDVRALDIQTREIFVQGLYSGGSNGRVLLKNPTVLGAGDAFTAYVEAVGI